MLTLVQAKLMNALGDAIKELRSNSIYRDSRAFSVRVGISYESLRKIETGNRVPSEETINRILEVVDISKEEADAVRVLRNLAHAQREGLLNKSVTDDKIVSAAESCLGAVVGFLGEFEMALEDADQLALLQRLTDAIIGELRA